MKELSTKEKAKRYDEVIDKVAHFIKKHIGFGCMIHPNSSEAKELFNIFPELQKESENERIRKDIMHHIEFEYNHNIIPHQRAELWLAWLEKKGEQKHVVIIPKFRIGDEIKTSNEEPLTITKIDEKGYWSEDLFICDFSDAAKWKLVEQAPAWGEEDEYYYGIIRRILNFIKENGRIPESVVKPDRENATTWLKSIKERCSWKPSVEQTEALERMVNFAHFDEVKNRNIVIILLNELKKLREE